MSIRRFAVAAMAVLLTSFTASVALAIPIKGEIHFGGGAVLTGVDPSPAGATGITFDNPIEIEEGISIGDYGGLAAATTATFTDFTFGAVGTTGALSVSPFWTFSDAATGLTYEFRLTTVSENSIGGAGPTIARVIGGAGVARISGPGSSYEDTEGFWHLSTAGDSSTISFSSYAAGPDGGTGIALLGLAMLGLDIARRKLS